MSRARLTCPGIRVTCPACRHALPGLDVRDGHGFAVCSRKLGAFETRRTCGQHLYWSCTARLCTVVALTPAEYEALGSGHHTPAEIAAALGIGAALGEAA